MNSIMEKQEFIEKYNFVKESVISAMDKALERALENEVIDLSKCDGNLFRCLSANRSGFKERIKLYT